MSALGPYLRAQLASEEAFDNAGGVRFDDEPGPLPLDRQPPKSFNQPTVFTVARAPAPVAVPVTPFANKRAAGGMWRQCAADIQETHDYYSLINK